MRVSVIVVGYQMQRELPRTLQALSPRYQLNCEPTDYEVIVVDNGSPEPLETSLHSVPEDLSLRWLRLDPAPVSPAQALNRAVAMARGDIVCLMVDGAHLLTPGVLDWAGRAFAAFDEPVVAVRYFYLGPGEQPETVKSGYNQTREDALLDSIDWPRDGYRLFEVGTPLWGGAERITWFNRMFESNCLFMRRDLFLALGGADERFDLPGGGFLNLDLYKRAVDSEGVVPVQLVGEGSFHQVHGGTTTNSSDTLRDARLADYLAQYQALRGHQRLVSDKPLTFLGHLPTQASKIHLRKRGNPVD
ncbi:glycosyltransferase family 2 protein [Haliea atlantica]